MAESTVTTAPAPPAERRTTETLEFPGCHALRISRAEIADYEGRIEYWDRDTEVAMVCEPVGYYHERPAHRLAMLAGRIAAARGAPIEAVGHTDLLVRNARGERQRIMQADQILFLSPAQTVPHDKAIEVGMDTLPDVVLEVDNTTDVLRGKLSLYESWGLPELWVEVPDEPEPSRPASLRPGFDLSAPTREVAHRAGEPRLSGLDGRGDSPGAERARAVRRDHGGAPPRGACAGRGARHAAGRRSVPRARREPCGRAGTRPRRGGPRGGVRGLCGSRHSRLDLPPSGD